MQVAFRLLPQCQKHCLDCNMARQTHGAYTCNGGKMLAGIHKESECGRGRWIWPPALWKDYGVLLIKKKLPRGMNRQDSIYYTTKRNYFVIKFNLNCSEHPWSPTKLTGGNCFHVAEKSIPLRSNYWLWSVLNVFESRWREDSIFSNAMGHINVLTYSFYVKRIYVLV